MPRPRPRSLHIGSHSAPRRPTSRPAATHSAPRTSTAVGQRLLDARCMLLLLPPPGRLLRFWRGPPPASAGLSKFKYVSGPSPSNEIKPSGHHEPFSQRAANPTAACATP
jgi:hypothetical protein